MASKAKTKAAVQEKAEAAKDAEIEKKLEEATKLYMCHDGTTMKGEVVEPGEEIELTPSRARNMTDRDVRLSEVVE
jgi:hypothetical protein